MNDTYIGIGNSTLSNETNTSDSKMDPSQLPGYYQVMALRATYIWVLAGVGLTGNLASFITILSMKMSSAAFFVLVLAATDSMALVVKLISHQLSSHAMYSVFTCSLDWTVTWSTCCANWVLVLICFDRFVAVCFPLMKVHFTMRRAYISVAVLLVALLAYFAPLGFFTTVSEGRKSCNYHYITIDWYVFPAYMLIPFIIVAVLSVLIIVCLRRQDRERMALQTLPSRQDSRAAASRAFSIMLVCTGLFFLLVTLPACVYHLFLKGPANPWKDFVTYQAVTFVSDVNHAINFIIYFLSSARFRNRFLTLLKERCCKLCCCHTTEMQAAPATAIEGHMPQ